MPRAGGWDDQDAGLVEDDWGYLNHCYNHAVAVADGKVAAVGGVQQVIADHTLAGTTMSWEATFDGE